MRIIIGVVAAVTLALELTVQISHADVEERKRCTKTGSCYVIGTRKPVPGKSDPSKTPKPINEDLPSDPDRNDLQREFEKEYDAWAKASDVYRECLTRFSPIGRTAVCGTAPSLPDMSIATGFSRPGTGPTITPAQAGAVAAARLQLPTLAPGIGPSPQLNPWKMAAVGYPLWLWPDGPIQVGPVADSVGGLSVSLTAKVSDVSFRMGDGNTVTCPAESKRWTNAVEPGQKSPTCGYAYEKPSLPKGNYTVTAVTTWNVTWTVNNQSGVITVPAMQATQLPVGELQVLVR